MSSKSHEEIYAQFSETVNMQPRELEDWLKTDESNSVGDADRGESTGHRSGRRIVEMKRTSKSDLSDADYQHMNKVVGYIKRHLAQRPAGDVEASDWRYSLMNWGHDPLKEN
jgi:hypothetical protein